MANYCRNLLFVSGPKVELEFYKNYVVSKCAKEDLSFDKILPMPKELLNTTTKKPTTSDELKKFKRLIRKYGHYNWLHWCEEHWGTRWDAIEVEREQEYEGELKYFFNTGHDALSKELMETMSGKFPALTFELYFEEEFEAYKGECKYKDGEEIESKGWPVKFDE